MKNSNNLNNTPYSWFNGGSSNAKPKLTPKQYLKVFLKFFKLFFFIILLMLTVTACGQSFSIRTNNNIGNGVEFYHNKNKVQPFSIIAHPENGHQVISNVGGNSYLNLLTNDMKLETPVAGNSGVLDYIHNYYGSEFPKAYEGKYYPLVAVLSEQTDGKYEVYGTVQRNADGYAHVSQLVGGWTYNPTTKNWSNKVVNKPLYDTNGTVYNASPKGDMSDDAKKKLNVFSINEKGLLYAKKNTDHYLKTWRPVVSWAGAWHYGPWYGMLVYPIFMASNSLLLSFGGSGFWAVALMIIILVLIMRSSQYALSFKSMNQSYKMQEVQGQLAAINAKYTQYKDNPYMQKKKQAEIMAFYKKENINPLAMIVPVIFMMPFFLTMWRIIEGNSIIKTTSAHGLYFSISLWSGLAKMHWIYLTLLFPALIVQVTQVMLPMQLSKLRRKSVTQTAKKAANKQNKMMFAMIAMMSVMCFIIPAGMSIYWVASGLFTIGTQLINHFIFLKKRTKVKKS